MSVRDLSRYKRFRVTQFEGIGAFSRSRIPQGVASINYNGGLLDILVRRRPGADTTLVVFHAAVKRTATRPIFNGLGVAKGLDANLLLISDPTLELYERLTLSWFAGNRKQRLQTDLPELLSHIFEKFNSRHIVFYGGSGGGFASLYYSSRFQGSLAIASNPQTSIGKFWPTTVTAYVRSAFGKTVDVPSALARLDAYGIVHDLCAHYRRDHGNSIAYLQNVPDARHVGRHLLPFYDAVAPGVANYLMGDWGPGHHAPPRALVERVLQAAVNAQGEWRDLMVEGFLPHVPVDSLALQVEGSVETEGDWFAL